MVFGLASSDGERLMVFLVFVLFEPINLFGHYLTKSHTFLLAHQFRRLGANGALDDVDITAVAVDDLAAVAT